MNSAIVVLDTNILSILVERPKSSQVLDCISWVKKLVANNIAVVVPEIADYESRRKLLCVNKDPIKETTRLEKLQRLDSLGKQGLMYLPINTEAMLKAASLWAWAKNTNQSTEDGVLQRFMKNSAISHETLAQREF
ncbi:hypothetical protein Cylst_2176 [Cylindrospermum stagnale PCC 7417]|uniref:Nucleic acid-binding protein, contains PIN domain n=1 Tax=Cylindrospermum stagnale PCC 7417 TaxID=56107 RepID=K9WY18_9NOST|nr:hypothetical protein [Cylindrospermum stagnale]AFZ24412.1 hypothetical protein Cylst_2176 [Cylindrospermum stagnale PCC 7417]